MRTIRSFSPGRKEARRRFRLPFIAAAAVLAFLPPGDGLRAGRTGAQDRPAGFSLIKTVSVPGTGWADTGIDVEAGQVFWLEAEGTISLQKDNPVAECGPDGLKLRTMQQPLPDHNIGSLVGKVRVSLEVHEDKETGEKTFRERAEFFFVGPAGAAVIPAVGRLFLGPNENVTGDNDGMFEVRIYAKQDLTRPA